MKQLRPIPHLLLLLALPAFYAETSRSATAQETNTTPQHDATAFVLADDVPEGLWIELTPLANPQTDTARSARDLRPALLLPEDSEPGLTWLPERAPGAAMLCRGAVPALQTDEPAVAAEEPFWAVACDLVALWRNEPEALLPPPDDLVIEVTPETGPQVVGRYLLGDLPVAGAVISVVPARLDMPVPFSVPLSWNDGRLLRTVQSRDDGTFALPRLAPGDYVLEARLPGGRLHRSEAFAVPAVAELKTNAGQVAEEDLFFHLGDFDLREGLSLEVRASGPDAGPVGGVDVTVRQGATPADLATFRARTDDDGVAQIYGLLVESPSVLTCAAPGLATVRQEWQLLPVIVDCDMEPLAAVAGEVFDPQGQPIPGAVVRLMPVEDPTASEGPMAQRAVLQTTPDAEGAFLFADCRAGDWQVEAAAPGFRVEQRTLRLEAGDRSLLEPMHLLPGREVLVRVTGPDGRPVPGAEIESVQPAGSVSATAGEDGEARFAHPGPETTVEVRGLEYAAERLRLPAERTAGAEGPFDVTLRPGGWIRVLMSLGPTASEDSPEQIGTPCAGCEVWIESRDGTGPSRLVTDGRGEALSKALRAGLHRVQRSRFSQSGSTIVEEPKAEERTVRVTEGEVTTVRFDAGEGAVTLRFAPQPDPGLGPWSVITLSGASRKIAPPESDGSYRLDLPEGTARDTPVTLRLQRFDPISGAEVWTRVAELPSWPKDDFEIALSKGQVKGRALRTDTSAAEAPAVGALVRLLGFHDFANVAEVSVAPDGTFLLPHLAPGVYSVQIRDLIYTYVALQPGQNLDLGALRLAPGVSP